MTPRGSRRVLVVDDHSDSRAIAVELMRRAGYEVVEAADGAEALQVAGAAPPDLLLIDFSMPGIDGVELTRRLRQEPRTRHVPIIMLTAHTTEAHAARALTAGCEAVLRKPYDADELQRLVAAHLRGRRR